MVMEARRNPSFRAALDSCALSVCDTIGLLVASRLRGGPLRERITGVELLAALAGRGRSQRDDLRFYFLGGKGDTARRAADELARRFPGVRIAGARDGYFGSDAEVVGAVTESGANVLVAGLGSPKQEMWLAENLAASGCGVGIGVGGTFDVLAGTVRRAPGACGRSSGLEWALPAGLASPRRWRRRSWRCPAFAALLALARGALRSASRRVDTPSMKAMILAGGMSTRLYPLTHQVPKPLVPVAGEPITAQILRYLRSFGIHEVAINVHYHADQILERFGDGSEFGVRLHYLHEEKLMGSAGAVKQMENFFRDDDFVVIGCDDLTDLDLESVVKFHKERGAMATIALYEAETVEQYGVVITDESGRITDFQEKPPRGTEHSHLVNTGIYCFDPAIFSHIAAGTFIDFGKDVFPALQRANSAFYGLLMPGAYWCDIGTFPEYRRASNDVLSGRVRLRGERSNGIPHDVILGQGVTIEGPVRIGKGVRLAEGVRIVGPTVVGDHSTVGAGATLERTILWDDVVVGDGAHLEGAIVGMSYQVAPGARLSGDVVANAEPVAG